MSTQPSTSALSVTSGGNGLPKVVLAAADGARAEVYLHGAHVTAWTPAGGGADRLFLSQTAEFGPQSAIRGGIPVIFPQFSNLGPLANHGFARRMEWRFSGGETGADIARAAFLLYDDDATRAVWPHPFRADLEVTVGGAALSLALSVTNPGSEPFSFTCALHTYLRVADIRQTRLEGLGGRTYLDDTANRAERVQPAGALTFAGEVDRIYPGAPDTLSVVEPERSLRIEKHGFPDVVVWNPGKQRGASLPDLEPDGYRRMLCIEPAAILQPITLAPGQSWSGTQRLVSG
jgi:glucose-6-phosphate 1-epimerase